jgi:hypothetical protein
MTASFEELPSHRQDPLVTGIIDGLHSIDTRGEIRAVLLHIVPQFEFLIAWSGE